MLLTAAPLHPTHAWQLMFAPLQHHDSGWLDVGDGHEMYWEQSGHPGGAAALVLHGGPGAGSSASDRRWFNPEHWRIVSFDQRGCGRSRAAHALHANGTPQLLADIEALRRHLGVDRWLLFGGSWGTTLALAYAQQYPRHVSGLVLRGVFMATRAETEWLYGPRGAALRHPQAWRRLCAALGVTAAADLLQAMHDQLQGKDASDAKVLTAAHAWCAWEHDLMDAETTLAPAPRPPLADEQALAQARIGVHYARAGWFIEEGRLLADAVRLAGLPGVIVQGQRDLVTPPTAARALHAAWPQAQLCEVATAGHASSHPSIARHLVHAIEALVPTLQETNHVRIKSG